MRGFLACDPRTQNENMTERKRSLDVPSTGKESNPQKCKRRPSSPHGNTAELLLLLSRPAEQVAISGNLTVSENLESSPEGRPVTDNSSAPVDSSSSSTEKQETSPASHGNENSINYSARQALDNVRQGELSSSSGKHCATENTIRSTARVSSRKNTAAQSLSPLAAPPQLPNVKFGSIVKRSHQ